MSLELQQGEPAGFQTSGKPQSVCDMMLPPPEQILSAWWGGSPWHTDRM